MRSTTVAILAVILVSLLSVPGFCLFSNGYFERPAEFSPETRAAPSIRFEGRIPPAYPLDDDEDANIGASDFYAGKNSAQDKSIGVLKMVSGAILVPLGGMISISNSFEKCQENDGIFSIGVGPCSKSGPSKTGQAIGLGVSLSGLYLLISGIVDITN